MYTTPHNLELKFIPADRHSKIPPPMLGSEDGSGFTLIELLVVIAIIAILAGLSFPAVQGALSSGKKAQARNDVNQIAAAVKAFQLEYGRLPTTAPASASESPSSNNNSPVMLALTGQDLNLNPRSIIFFEPKIAKGGKSGMTNNRYLDPWGASYMIGLDNSYDNKIVWNNQTNFTTVIVATTAGSTNTNNMISNVK